MTLEEKLQISKNTQEKIEKHIPIQTLKSKTGMVSSSVEALDKAVFGVPEKTSGYDAREEMRQIQERAKHNTVADFSNSKIPSAIIESIKQNPLNIEPSDPKMDAFTEKLATSVPSIQRSLEIQKMLEGKNAKSKSAQEQTYKPSNNGIDYEMVKLIVENAVKKEVSALKENFINETTTHNGVSDIKALKLSESGKFIFLDSENNLYECVLKYIGKNKKRK